MDTGCQTPYINVFLNVYVRIWHHEQNCGYHANVRPESLHSFAAVSVSLLNYLQLLHVDADAGILAIRDRESKAGCVDQQIVVKSFVCCSLIFGLELFIL